MASGAGDRRGPLAIEPGPAFIAPSDDEHQEPDDARQVDEPALEREYPDVVDELGELGPLEPVTEEQVRDVLRAQGTLLHGFAAVDAGSTEWVWLEHELDSMAPPLTRIINRYPALQRLAAAGDWLPVLMATGAYGGRSLRERGAAIARLRAAQEREDQAAGVVEFTAAR